MDTLNEFNNTITCFTHSATKLAGIFFGQNPFRFTTTVLLAQISICSLCCAIVEFFVTPLGETNFVSQIVVGVILGPSITGKSPMFTEYIFSRSSMYVSNILGYFGVILFLFLVGVKTDFSIIRHSGNKAMVIGFSVFFVPLLLNLSMAAIFRRSLLMKPSLHQSIYWVASFQATNSFHVIICLLADLKLLNTEIGRLAISSSMISGTCGWVWTEILFASKQSATSGKWQDKLTLLCVFFISTVLIIVYILRPITLWMVRRNVHDTIFREGHLIWVFIMIMGCSLYGEAVGLHFLIGPMIFGMAIPSGPPLGSALVTKLESFVSYLIMPLYFAINGARIDFSAIHAGTAGIILVLATFGFMFKTMAAMLPCVYFKTSIHDAFHIGLIMSTQGIVDVLFLGRAVRIGLIDKETYSIMVITEVVFAIITSPMVKFLYKPSHRLSNYRRTIQHSKPYGELRMLVCVHHQDHTPSMINLIEATNPSPKSPICVYLIHLIELLGRAAPILVAHQHGKTASSHSSQSDSIINAFRIYEKQNHGILSVYPFTSISPYATMHDEVCGLAIEKKVSIMIIPFHNLLTIQASEVSSNAIRTVNLNILKMAPCSIGIFVDRGSMKGNIHISANKNAYSIGVLFLGGQDDREALAYGSRMAKHPNVALKVLRFIDPNMNERPYNEVDQDWEMITTFKDENLTTENCVYLEEHVKDSVELVTAVMKIENIFDLILVGRRHSVSPIMSEGLTEWNEYPELGCIGDMLVSSDSCCKVSVLVVQQQCLVDEKATLVKPKLHNDQGMPNVKVWPIL